MKLINIFLEKTYYVKRQDFFHIFLSKIVLLMV
jgi:hypothetical protein